MGLPPQAGGWHVSVNGKFKAQPLQVVDWSVEAVRRKQCVLLYAGLIREIFGKFCPTDSRRESASGEALPMLTTALDKLAVACPAEQAGLLHTVPLDDAERTCAQRLDYWEACWRDVSLCQICFEPTPAKYLGYGLEGKCGHGSAFCAACLHRYAVDQLESCSVTAQGIRCPAEGCLTPIEKECTARVLTKAQDAKLQRLRRTAVISQSPNLRWCPQPDCETVIDTLIGSRCPKCARCICTECGAEAHEGACEEAADQNLQALAKQMGWKRCPFCKKIVARTEGCNSMQCHYLGCQQTFCYGCGEHPCKCADRVSQPA